MTSADLDGIDEPQTAEASNSDNLQQQAPQTGAVLAKAPRKRATSKKPAQRNKGPVLLWSHLDKGSDAEAV